MRAEHVAMRYRTTGRSADGTAGSDCNPGPRPRSSRPREQVNLTGVTPGGNQGCHQSHPPGQGRHESHPPRSTVSPESPLGVSPTTPRGGDSLSGVTLRSPESSLACLFVQYFFPQYLLYVEVLQSRIGHAWIFHVWPGRGRRLPLHVPQPRIIRPDITRPADLC